jgi:hypothetical protein
MRLGTPFRPLRFTNTYNGIEIVIWKRAIREGLYLDQIPSDCLIKTHVPMTRSTTIASWASERSYDVKAHERRAMFTNPTFELFLSNAPIPTPPRTRSYLGWRRYQALVEDAPTRTLKLGCRSERFIRPLRF